MGFANISRHPAEKWPRDQILAAAEIGGGIQDYEFPKISPEASEDTVWETVNQVAYQIEHAGHKHAMVVGEYAATLALVQMLIDRDIRIWMPSFHNGHIIEQRGDQRLRTRPFVRFREVTKFLRRQQ